MAQPVDREIPPEHVRNNENTVTLRTSVTFSEDDLSDEAKTQFEFHNEILRIFQLYAKHVLANDQLSPIGRHLVCTSLERNYMNSKLVLNYIASHPELKTTATVMPHPLVLCGLPRTGSTLLYNLMACDPACRAPLYVEMAHPVPPLARSDTTGQMQRNIAAQGFREILDASGLTDYQQAMRASHPHFTHEEDLYILYHAGYSWFPAMLTSPDDNELLMWFEDDMNKNFIYKYHKTFIQMLNSVDAPRSHWLFKAPLHSLQLDELMQHYPSALFIMTHRQLDEAIPSACRLTTVYAGPYFDINTTNTAVNMQAAVKRIIHLMNTLIHRIVKFRCNHQHIPCIDILYDDLLAQPIDTVRRIYNHFGLAWSEEFEMAMLAWLRDNPQRKQGRNSYTLNDYGMTLDDIELCYKEYISMFLNSQHSSNEDYSMVKNMGPTMNSMKSPSDE